MSVDKWKIGVMTLIGMTLMWKVAIQPLIERYELSPLLVREKVKVEVVEIEKTVVKEKEIVKRIGENYSDLDRDLLAFCIESGKISCSLKSTNDWAYWQRKRDQLNKLEEKLINDHLIKREKQ